MGRKNKNREMTKKAKLDYPRKIVEEVNFAIQRLGGVEQGIERLKGALEDLKLDLNTLTLVEEDLQSAKRTMKEAVKEELNRRRKGDRPEGGE